MAELLRRGAGHGAVRAAIDRLGGYGAWPLSEARLATVRGGRRPGLALFEKGQWLVLGPRGWQAVANGIALDEVRLRLRREPLG